MDARTIETRLKEIAGGAEMVTTPQIMKYTGTSRHWVYDRMRESGMKTVKNLWHIRDVAKALETH